MCDFDVGSIERVGKIQYLSNFRYYAELLEKSSDNVILDEMNSDDLLNNRIRVQFLLSPFDQIEFLFCSCCK